MNGSFTGHLAGHYNFWIVILLMMTGLYVVVSRGHLVKKVIGLNLFQVSMFLLYVSMGKVAGGTAPILTGVAGQVYSNPLPHVLILTAIVVGISTTALALAMIVRIQEAYGTVEEDEIAAADRAADDTADDTGSREQSPGANRDRAP